MIIFIFVLLIVFYMLLDVFYLAHQRIKVNTTLLSKGVKISPPLKIAFISDLHYSNKTGRKFMTLLVKKINEAQPDLILLGGDLLTKKGAHSLSKENIDFCITMLSQLAAPLGKYSVFGNHDYEDSLTQDLVEKILDDSSIAIINNQQLILHHQQHKIQLVGLDSEDDGRPDFIVPFKNLDPDIFTIVLEHTPDTFLKLSDKPFHLMLSGHSHGGQVRLPLIGSIIKNDYAKTFDYGLHKRDKKTLIVSAGLGTTGIRVRLFNDPSIEIIVVE